MIKSHIKDDQIYMADTYLIGRHSLGKLTLSATDSNIHINADAHKHIYQCSYYKAFQMVIL